MGGAIIAEDVDLELLGPGGLAKLGGEGEAALGDVVVPILPSMEFSAMFDLGAHVQDCKEEVRERREQSYY